MNRLLDAARSALIAHNLAVSGTDPQVIRLPLAATDELIRSVARSGATIDQIVPYTGRRQYEEEFARHAWRRHASAGHDVRRLYLVPYGTPSPRTVEDEVRRDDDCGITAHPVYLDGLYRADTAESRVPMTNVWLVDDQVVVYQEHGDSGTPTWVVSARDEDVRTARQRWETVWPLGSRRAHHPPRVAEPLLDSADMLHALAQFSCTGHYVDRVSCAWYHGAWQYLRLFNMVSSPNWHADFYARSLREALHGLGRARVLITGTADYATLAQVLTAAAEEKPGALEIHVLDTCLTPLLANRWYARRMGVEVGIHQIDFLTAGPELAGELGSFDVIVTDAFLTRFRAVEALKVFANWRRLLRPDGHLITTVRLHDRYATGEGPSEQVTEYLLRLYERAKNSHWLLRIDFDELRDAAREYALKMISWTELGGTPTIQELFRENGFTVVDSSEGHVPGELTETDYLRIMCRADNRSS
ncbi:SAM-dependent methyltransferase [Actinoplanes octamycinicus]|uniref:SAM-dependent methyltransferase n=1 Tax=Actinoplanes octamycinicus TaxID=135948 RepID=A0A7W7M9X9_9ACTN|nr:class I SAM-dependent methyltransferase [Actinoplanes octamycinicus]MBB4742488.1 SAM-dependent methyltransferase [Actinoplanes octamycinicus]GIE60826.1 hypothetical protein Aoc01nite_62280 [Actinoplanes octamycinicus]